MTMRPIRNDEDLQVAFRRLKAVYHADEQTNRRTDEQTPEADERDVLVTLVEAYENRHYDFGPADPVDAIKVHMEQQGLTPRDL